MMRMSDDIGRMAAHYIAVHGDRAYARIGDDISRAIGRREWDAVHNLQSAQLRVRRVQLCEQIAERLALSSRRAPVEESAQRSMGRRAVSS